jgi:hypothetical protein
MLYTRYVKVADIKIHEILAMHALFERYYDHGPLDTFIRDLSRKDGAFIVRHKRDDRIVGFSTMAIFDIPHQGKVVKGMFSGDTVLEKASSTANAWCWTLATTRTASRARWPTLTRPCASASPTLPFLNAATRAGTTGMSCPALRPWGSRPCSWP